MTQSRVSAVRYKLGVFTGEVLVIEHLALFTGDEAGLALYASDQAVAVAGHGETGEGPELGGLRVGGHFRRALEADDRFWITERLQQIRPVASMGSVIVDQARGARLLLRDTEGALDVAGGALFAVRVDAELELAAGRRVGDQVSFPVSAIDRPVVVAVVVYSALAVKQ